MEEAKPGGYQGYLFLLEFLVDNLQTLDSFDTMQKIGNDKCAWFRAQTRVTFQFGPYQPVEIWDEEFPDRRPCSSEESRWKSGKSCLFALKGVDIEKGISSFIVFVSAYRRLSAGFHPGDILIGTGDHEIKDAFNAVLGMMQNDPYEIPASKTVKLGNCLKKCAKDIDVGETPCIGGELQLYARLSCYGKCVCTAFHIEEDEQSFFIKPKGEAQTIHCDRLPVPYCPRPPICRMTPAFPPLKPAKTPCKAKPPKPCPPPSCPPPICPRRVRLANPYVPKPCPPPVCPPPVCPRRVYFPPSCVQPVYPQPLCAPPVCLPPSCAPPVCFPPSCAPPGCFPPSCAPPSGPPRKSEYDVPLKKVAEDRVPNLPKPPEQKPPPAPASAPAKNASKVSPKPK